MNRKRIVITGAAGGVIGRILPRLRELYDLVLLDMFDTDQGGRPIEGIHKVDLINPNRDEYRQFFRGADMVIHAAYTFSLRINNDGISSNINPEAGNQRFKRASDDIQMTHNIYRMALEENIKRVIVFSSNHATDYYEHLIRKGVLETVTEDMVPYSDNLYGWTKICGEALGHIFAEGNESGEKALEVIAIRFGAPREDLIENVTSKDYYHIRRHFASYLSADDELQLIKLCIETEDIRDENGVPFLMFYGTSDNYNRIWSLRNARHALGYEPKDSSYSDFSERITGLFNENIKQETEHRKGKKGGN